MADGTEFGKKASGIKALRAACAVLALVAACAAPAAAQFTTRQGVVSGAVQEIRIEGTQRIAPETVRSYVAIQPGDTLDGENLDKALKALFGTGLFADVTLRQEGSALVVRVVENPIVNRIAFEGNSRIKDETLIPEMGLKPRTVFTRAKIQADVKRLQDIYRRTGRFAATVEPKIIELPQNRVDVVYEIEEGAITGIQRINFVGNKEFADGSLREQIQTRESRWWRFLSNDDVYDPDRLSYDRELLRKYYLAYGYADFRVVSAIAELSPDRAGFNVTFTLDEGERYRFGKIEVVSQIRDLKPEDLIRQVTASEGSWYNADKVEGSVNALTDYANSKGFGFADVRPRVTRDRDGRTIAIVFEVQEGPRVYVERVNIVGNVRTIDKVIRREMQLVEGDALNNAKIRRSRERIRGLGYFERVDITNTPGDAPDKSVVNVEVQEKSTGEVSFGVGYSSADGPLFDTSIRERNLLGRGQDIRLGGTISGRRQQIDFSFTQPYFLDREMAAGIDIFRLQRDYQREAGYDYRTTGAIPRLTYPISEYTTQEVRYTIRNDEVTNVDAGASNVVKDAAGEVLLSGFGHTTTYDRRDDRQDPTDGYYVRLTNDVAGAGGDAKFLRSGVSGGFYYPIIPEYVIALTGEVGYIFGLSDDKVRLQHRYFLGGDNLRGFRTQGVGPRDQSTGGALGGNRFYTTTAELQFPTGLPKEFGLRGALFSDVGSLWSIDRPAAGRPGANSPIDDSSGVRASVGAGLMWRSPFGPIRVSMAKAVVKEEFDRTELFRFQFGSRF
jgi:outer membrane protein insertion porin family